MSKYQKLKFIDIIEVVDTVNSKGCDRLTHIDDKQLIGNSDIESHIRIMIDEKNLNELIKTRIKLLESLDGLCHNWVANELKTIFNIGNKYKSTKFEKEYAINIIKGIMKSYKIKPKDLKMVSG